MTIYIFCSSYSGLFQIVEESIFNEDDLDYKIFIMLVLH